MQKSVETINLNYLRQLNQQLILLYNKIKAWVMNNEEGKFKFGIFYFDTNDRRILVPKRICWMGWTFNFGNKYVYLMIVLVIALILILHK